MREERYVRVCVCVSGCRYGMRTLATSPESPGEGRGCRRNVGSHATSPASSPRSCRSINLQPRSSKAFMREDLEGGHCRLHE
ncbi:hypothetical protein E2C01_022488 [Portunus trituberculatus]|uniref:Uncharacterized protein n=1 Tax=Portunus trituberculatus TaxID=210409 RepID=A0A5B7E915_PORTR|nr:hypothetical protein [Portunus trituberculatus]